MGIRRAQMVAVGASLLLVASCGTSTMFFDAGTDNGTSVPFRVPAGVVEIGYRVTDREPWFGCNFGVELVAPERDALASGHVIATTEVFDVAPRGVTSGRLVSSALAPGEYFLRYLGDRPCNWSVTVSWS